MIRTLFRATLPLVGLAAPAAAQQSPVGISKLPIATAVNPQTDYVLGIVQQLSPAGLPFFVTFKVPMAKLVGPTGPQGIQGPIGPPGTSGTGSGNVSSSGNYTIGDILLAANSSGTATADGGAPGSAAFKPVAFFLQSANNLSDVASPSAARVALAAAKSGANTDITSLGGLTVPLSVGQGGTGASSPIGILAGLGLNGAGATSFRNRLIDAGFAINQRGYASGNALSAGTYGHDRWKAGSGGLTYTFSQALPTTLVTITAGTAVQVIEASNMEGGNYTMSWAGSAQCRVTYTVSGASSTTTSGYAASPFTVANLAANTGAQVECGAGSGSGNVTLAKPQFEPGTVPSAFEVRPYGVELQMATRYYQTLSLIGNVWCGDGSAYGTPFTFQPMRSSPTATTTVVSANNAASGYPYPSIYTASAGSLNVASAGGAGDVSYNVTITLGAEL